MRLAIFLFLFLLTPLSLAVANEASQTYVNDRICVFSVPESIFDLPAIALDKAKLTLDQAKDVALAAAKALPGKVDGLALTLADKLESTKNTPGVSQTYTDPQVLGARTDSGQPLSASAYNAGVDVLSLLLRHWLWTVSGLATLALFWTFKS